jgi:dephospho-CoA kinase
VLTLRKIAVTGGLSAGKSTVCGLLKEYGAYVVDADKIVHSLLSPDTPIGKRVVALLGPEIITGNQINRKKISDIVFSNPTKLTALEAILHPAVRQEINNQYNHVKNNPAYLFFVAEVPLLYEAGMEEDFDTVIAVVADERSNMRERRIRQLPPSLKALRADYTISNNGDMASLRLSVHNLVKHF